MDDLSNNPKSRKKTKKVKKSGLFYLGVVIGFIVGHILCYKVIRFGFLAGAIHNENYELLRNVRNESYNKRVEFMLDRSWRGIVHLEEGESLFIEDNDEMKESVVLYGEWVKDWLLQEDGDEKEWESSKWLSGNRIEIIGRGDYVSSSHGNKAKTYIAPKGIKFRYSEHGDNKILHWDEDGKVINEGNKTVIIYADVLRYLKGQKNRELEKVLESKKN